jgi:hypothetical protein
VDHHVRGRGIEGRDFLVNGNETLLGIHHLQPVLFSSFFVGQFQLFSNGIEDEFVDSDTYSLTMRVNSFQKLLGHFYLKDLSLAVFFR